MKAVARSSESMENEFMSSSAPWEVTLIYVQEWIGGGSGGKEHMRF